MKISQKLLDIMKESNLTIDQAARLINVSPKRLQKQFDENKIRYIDAQKITTILGYKITFTKKLI